MIKPIKIAMMVRAYIPMPRPSDMIYAPIDLAVAIAKGLGEKGHAVTLFAPIGTEVYGHNVQVETMNLRPLVKNQAEFNAFLDDTDHLSHNLHALWDHYMVNEMFRRANLGEFDLLHFHHPESALAIASRYPKVPTVYTLHDPIYPWYREVFEMYSSLNQRFISISDNQRRDAPDLPYLDTVYNGTNVNLFTFSEEHEDYLMFSGRITAQKGVKEAIQVAKESGHRLLIIGPIDHGSQDYFNQHIRPQLDDQILYLGRMDQDMLPKYYQKAKAVLTPVQWEEPFGLTTIEAMACGTPVISFHRGAAPEIIQDGRSGYIVHSIAEMVEAVGKIDRISRTDCRRHVEEKFSEVKMIHGYEKAYEKLITQSKPAARGETRRLVSKLNKVKKLITHLPTTSPTKK